MGDNETARQYARQALEIAREEGERRAQAYVPICLGHALAGLGRLDEAQDAYRQGLELLREFGHWDRAADGLAGLARIALAQDHLPEAQACVEEILSYLETGNLDRLFEPFRVYLTCYRVLRAADDPRAGGVLETAHRLLQERAAKISDEEERRSYLENVAAHREIVSAYAGERLGG
jgi:tetratricopeptide (TPR) repeat protein